MTRVLLVEDDVQFREALEEALSSRGYDVRLAGDVEEACCRVAAEPFDVVLSDVCMPGDGRKLPTRVARLRPGLPVILMSAFAEPGAHTWALPLGARVLLRKPMPLGLLDAVLSNTVGRGGGGRV